MDNPAARLRKVRKPLILLPEKAQEPGSLEHRGDGGGPGRALRLIMIGPLRSTSNVGIG